MAAVQCLYQQSFEEKPLAAEQLIERVLSVEDDEEKLPSPPDDKLLRGIVTGALAQRQTLEQKLSEAIPAHWDGTRLTPLLRAILCAATYELLFHPELKTAIILSEYVALTAAFFDEQETALINGLLQELAKKARASS